jgi:hypothetical protein
VSSQRAATVPQVRPIAMPSARQCSRTPRPPSLQGERVYASHARRGSTPSLARRHRAVSRAHRAVSRAHRAVSRAHRAVSRAHRALSRAHRALSRRRAVAWQTPSSMSTSLLRSRGAEHRRSSCRTHRRTARRGRGTSRDRSASFVSPLNSGAIARLRSRVSGCCRRRRECHRRRT